MDTAARRLLPRNNIGGIEVLHFLDSVFTPHMADWELEEHKQTLTSPQRKIVETPLRYFLRLQETQSNLHNHGHIVDIFIKGLIVNKTKDRNNNIILKTEVDKIEQDGIWPRTWLPALNP